MGGFFVIIFLLVRADFLMCHNGGNKNFILKVKNMDNINTTGNPIDYLSFKIICVILYYSNSLADGVASLILVHICVLSYPYSLILLLVFSLPKFLEPK